MTFRYWCSQKWYEHLDELDSIREKPTRTPQQYFNEHKWWLKSVYKSQFKCK